MKLPIQRLLHSPFIRFALSGGLAAGVNVLSRLLLSQLFVYEIAVFLAYMVGMTTAFVLMKFFVFDRSGRAVAQEYVRFGLVNIIALLQVWLVSVGLARWLFPAIGFYWHAETVAHIIGVLSPIAVSYIGHKRYTFAR